MPVVARLLPCALALPFISCLPAPDGFLLATVSPAPTPPTLAVASAPAHAEPPASARADAVSPNDDLALEIDSAASALVANVAAPADAAPLAPPPPAPDDYVPPSAEPLLPPRATGHECRLPRLMIPKTSACRRGAPYPACRWRMPRGPASRDLYGIWRNTSEERWWGRPGLVGVLLASAAEYARLFPDQRLLVGDLDAPGPRHRTHDRGVDVDLYLPGDMVTENAGAGAYPRNYTAREARDIEARRYRVEVLARALTSCANGAIRIYYNDPVVEQRFLAWYREQGFPENPFGAPMQVHNELHEFHFHVTFTDDQAVPPLTVAD